MNIKNKQKLGSAFAKNNRNLLVTGAVIATVLGGLALTNTKPVQAAVQTSTQQVRAAGRHGKLTKKAHIYNRHGKRIGKKSFKKGKKVKVYGVKTIKGVKYYSLGDGKYIPVKSVKLIANASKPATTPSTKPDTTPKQKKTTKDTTSDSDSSDSLEDVGTDGDCVLTYDEDSGTLHIAAGKEGNTLGSDKISDLLDNVDLNSDNDDDDDDDSDNGVTSISIDSKIVLPEDASGLFSDLEDLEDITGLNKVDTSNVTDMSAMFKDDESLGSLDLRSFDTSKVTDMSEMFSGDESLTTLDISNWDTSKVKDMTSMFSDDSSLTKLKTKNDDPYSLGNSNTTKDDMFDGTYLDSDSDDDDDDSDSNEDYEDYQDDEDD